MKVSQLHQLFRNTRKNFKLEQNSNPLQNNAGAYRMRNQTTREFVILNRYLVAYQPYVTLQTPGLQIIFVSKQVICPARDKC